MTDQGQAPSVEPVAWRFKLAPDDEWDLCFYDPRDDELAEVQPLYAHPAPNGEAGVVVPREALDDLINAADSFCEDGDLLAGEIRNRVRAMLSAAPPPSVGEGVRERVARALAAALARETCGAPPNDDDLTVARAVLPDVLSALRPDAGGA